MRCKRANCGESLKSLSYSLSLFVSFSERVFVVVVVATMKGRTNSLVFWSDEKKEKRLVLEVFCKRHT